MRMEKTTPADVAFILGNLSAQHKAEHAAMGVSRAMMVEHIARFMAYGHTETGWLDGRPAFVFGVFPEFGRTVTWFLATDAYFAHLSHVRHARRYLKDVAKRFGPLTTATRSPHPCTERWLKLIGYEKVEEVDGTKVFAYG